MKTGRKDIQDIIALTPMQEGMLFHYLQDPGSDYYFEQLSLDISGEIDIDIFEKAWNFVIQTNEMLRTVFCWQEVENPLQIILKEHHIQPGYYDFSGKEPGEKQKRLEEVMFNDRQKKFDLQDVPSRINLCKLEKDKFRMIISNHHILYDGWSNGIILKEFFKAYDDLSRGKGPVKPVKTRFKEFIHRVQNQDMEKQEKYWRSYLQGFDNCTELPVKRKKTVRVNHNKTYPWKWGSEKTSELMDFLKKHKLTLASLLYSAWGILLQKYNNSDDVVFGTTISGRSAKLAGIEDMVGLFINTLPLRTRTIPHEKAIDLLTRTETELRIRQNYEHSSLVNIRKWSEIGKGQEFFDSIVILENYPLEKRSITESKGLSIDTFSIFEMTHYDLTVSVSIFAEIEVKVIYPGDLFADETIERLVTHFNAIVETLIENPGQLTAGIEIISKEEKNKLLYDFNDTQAEYPAHKTIHQLFAEQVEKQPHQVALIGLNSKATGGGVRLEGTRGLAPLSELASITYRELNNQSSWLAHILIEKDIKPDTIAAIMVEHSIELIIGIMGILKAGGAYLPIDPDYPQERIEYMLKDSSAGVLVTTPKLQVKVKAEVEENSRHPRLPLQFIHIHTNPAFASEPSLSTLTSTSTYQVSPANMAYIIYTSGSTGRPRGVMVDHTGLVNLCTWHNRFYSVTARDRASKYAAVSFDASVWEIFPYLLSSASLYLIPDDIKLDMAALNCFFETHCITIAFLPTPVCERFMELENHSLRSLLTGGDWLKTFIKRNYQLFNNYGPTENTVVTTAGLVNQSAVNIPIGKPIDNNLIFILSPGYCHVQPIGVSGELYIGGENLARGYLNNPELTAEKFILATKTQRHKEFYFSWCLGALVAKFYRTGDLARWLSDGNIEFLGRIDHQVKIRGYRIELGEIENRLAAHKDIKEAVVVSRQDSQKENQVYAFIVSGKNLPAAELREYLAAQLPAYMIPAYFKQIEKIPLTSSGKLDRKALMSTAPGLEICAAYVPPASNIEKTIAEIWMELLGAEKVGVHDNFFDIGGNSLSIIRLNSRLKKVFKKDIPMATMFTYPTISAMAAHFSEGVKEKEEPQRGRETKKNVVNIAIIGMSCRFPGAKNIYEFWDNIKNGIESITFYAKEELIELGVGKEVMDDGYYVQAKGILDDKEYFDAAFFEYTPAEAEIMDPQMRLFHECCWEGLEDAGYDPGAYDGYIGLYAGASSNPLWEIPHLSSGTDYFERWGAIQLTDKDYISTRLGYKLGLKGPCITLQTACSTSLAAVDLACQGLLYQACDMALAGGVSITMHDEPGYHYREGAVMSRDGHCRPFDARANGTVGGNGAGSVVLKPLEDAIRDRDNIYAIIKSTAVNNDGKNKVGFTAPGVEGQANVIRAALQKAGVEPGSIGYIEVHGTGTVLGDPIEIGGLKQAFRSLEGAGTSPGNTCALGSVKANIGHLDAAAGIAGFIKTVLAIKHGLIPPSLHFETINPEIQLQNSPFYLNTRLTGWKNHDTLRRAGVSSFGIGGTNAHVVLEEWPGAPLPVAPLSDRQYHLILLSAKTETALDKMTENLTEYLKKNLLNPGNPANPTNPGQFLADTAYTLQVGRKAFKYRRKLVCSQADEAIEALSSPETWKVKAFYAKEETRSVIFMFPGLGAQYVNMGLELYRAEPIFHKEMDRCFQIVKPLLGYDLKDILYPDDSVSKLSPINSPLERGAPQGRGVSPSIDQIEIAQLVVFIIEYVLARLLMRWGITPKAMIGYSFGEYAAACLSGVFSLEDALKAIVSRGKLLTRVPTGAMLSVPLSHPEVTPLLTGELSVAIDNGLSCIVAGPGEAVAAFEKKIKQKKIMCMLVIHSLAMHSQMVEPILAKFEQELKNIILNPPGIPYISNVTGTWLTAAEAVTPHYWSQHLRKTVRFAEGIRELLKQPRPLFIEIGPARDLSGILSRFIDDNNGQKILNLLRPSREKVSDVYYLLDKIGNLWLYGVNIHWDTFYTGKERYRIPLPTYPFERKRFPVHADSLLLSTGTQERQKSLKTDRNDSVPDWFYSPMRAKQETGNKTHSRRQKHPRSELTTPYTAPENKTQHALVELFEEFFGIENIGIRDNFFELGGDSLKAVNLSSRIHKKLHIEISVAEFFNNPTIEALAQYILDKAKIDPYSSIEPLEKRDYYKLSSAQKRLFIIQQMEPGNIAYNIPFIFKLEGNLEREKLEWAIQSLISRHESIRTCFREVDGQPVQWIYDEVELVIGHWSLVIGKNDDGVGVDSIIKDFIRPFDLSQAPLLRIGLIKLPHTPTALRGHRHFSQEGKEDEYILMLDIHHITADGASMNILAGDFMSLYNGEELPWLRIQYKDFPGWRNTGKVKDSMHCQELYWLERYEEEIAILNLPTDYPRLSIQSYEGNRLSFELDNQECRALKNYAAKEGATLFMVLLAAYNILLAKLGSQEDIIVGTPIEGRRHSDLEPIIGMFVNTLALRNYPSGNKTFKMFLNEIKKKTLTDFENQDYPFEDLVEKLSPPRDPGRNPLFDTMFALQNMENPGMEIPGLKLKPYDYETNVSQFDLTLEARKIGENLSFIFEYCTALFKQETIRRFIRYFSNIVSTVLHNPDIRISRIEITSEEEKNRILYEFNDTDTDYPKDKTIHRLVEEQVERTPGHIALVGSSGIKYRTYMTHMTYISYRQLNEDSNRLAGLLIEKGIQPDTIAGLMIERSVEMIIGILGILKSGGAYLPIDPNYPQERVDYMLKDSKPVVVLTAPTIAESLNRSYKSHMSYISPENLLASQPPNFPLLPVTGSRQPATSLAYVIYTSGTTGKPKGVMVEHRNAVNLVNWYAHMHKLGSGTFLLQLCDYTFDPSVVQVFGALISGASLYIAQKEIRPDTEKMRNYIIHHTINLLDLVPTQLKELLCYNDKLESIHTVISAGEELDDGTKEIVIEKGYRLVNQYGPTETTVDTLALECSPGKVSMGKPISNVKVYILDRYEKVLPLGVVGELYIAGAGVSRGYLNRSELTAEKFCLRRPGALFEKTAPGPRKNFSLEMPRSNNYRSNRSYMSYLLKRHYKTGDLARWLPDGNIEFMGRIDHQVKIRGFRIEFGEIENQLLTHSKIKETILLARKDKNDKYLCAYFTAKPGETNPIDSSELREYLSQRLPVYMVPAYFVQLDNIPLTSNGKVDRKALPEPEIKAGKNYIAPRNETEKKLTEIWSDILDVEKEKIGIHDNFFHLGGHSLKATLLASRIHKELKVSVPLSEIFKTSHIQGLAAFVDSAVKNKYKKIEAVETKEYYPVFSAQERVYLSHQIDKSKFGYNLIHAVPLGENIEIHKLKSSLKKLVHRHESLRTSFEMVKGQIVQRVHRDLSFEIQHIRLDKSMDNFGVSLPQVEEVTVDFLRPFDLSAQPLFRIGLVDIGKIEHILIIGIHHIITDGRSLEILTEEFISLYTQKELFPFRLQYRDFSNWYNSPGQKILIKEQEAFWTSQFKDKITRLNLPSDFERPTVLTSEGGIVDFHLDSQKAGELGSIQIETDTTTFMILIAIYSVFLAKITNQEDILVGTPIAGRRHPDLQQITGMFVNTLVMRSQPTKDKSFREFLSQMKEYALKAFENQDYQFENLVELAGVKRDASRNPVFDIMFSYEDIDKTGDIESVIGQYDQRYKTSFFDFSLLVIDQKDTLKCTFFYNLNLFKKETIIRWVRYFQAVIDSIVNQPGIKLGDIDILPEEEKQRIPGKIDKTGEKDHQEEAPAKEEPQVEPETQKEREILAIWEKILGEKTPGVTADFFQSGGNSIGALLLVTEINKTFTRKLSITDIYENESIRKQATLVEKTIGPGKDEKLTRDKDILRLKFGPRGSKNIFLIHDATGEVDKYRLFCKELKPGDNYWGLPLKSTNGLAPQELEIKDLASGYLAVIKQVQARGPYYLGGWSIGGLIAFEMARQLEQAGEQVNRLYMFDTAVPGKNTRTQSFDLASELELINQYFQVPDTVSAGFKAANPGELWQEFLNFIENNETYNQGYIVDKLAEYAELISDFHRLPAAELFKYINRFRSTARAGSNYFPGTKIKAKLQYYQAELSDQDAANWQEFFMDKIDLHQTLGNHFNMFNGPNLRYLISIFQKNNHTS